VRSFGTAHAFAAHGEGDCSSNRVDLGPAQARGAGRGIDPGRAAIYVRLSKM
jgi:hypothetical protein